MTAAGGGNSGFAVETARLGRTFEPRGGRARGGGARTALDGLDLRLPYGEVHGLLGPNGAGKTTLCKILSTVLLPTTGTARVAGHDVVREARAVRRLIGLVFGGERGLYSRLTARQNLHYWAALYRQPAGGRGRADELLERVGLADRADDPVETYSRGMKQRLHLARGLIGDPRVLILDEPTTGMDPVAAHDFRSLVRELRDEGRTVLLTTHDMAEAEAVCDRVSLIDRGRLITTAQPRAIGGWLTRFEHVRAHGVGTALADTVADLPGVARARRDESGSVTFETGEQGAARTVVRHLMDAGVTSITVGPPPLEEVYLHLLGKDRGLAV
uniref:ABC transporter ATP-binding protein n=1 Tax=Streptomyces sp. MMG1612 TaxID=1415547 RepID=U5YMW2_9ACTN|nr:ABC transporter ATP-binding protein [Streptomyces sp. MMG1612]